MYSLARDQTYNEIQYMQCSPKQTCWDGQTDDEEEEPKFNVATTMPSEVKPTVSTEATPEEPISYSTLQSPLSYALVAIVFVILPAIVFVWLGGVRYVKRILSSRSEQGRGRSSSRSGSGDSGRGRYKIVRGGDLEK